MTQFKNMFNVGHMWSTQLNDGLTSDPFVSRTKNKDLRLASKNLRNDKSIDRFDPLICWEQDAWPTSA